ncbi:MAG: malic enzyme-like NAD(P)-binding protein [Sphaerochaeta sp.]|jgi:malate dehydrogenase (oxaloacetate-decarboxylating)(NADP+)|nr:malic enzyme-like NAD(P)-binding protein [Sphaerochaeta sp.]PKL28393.1 MAG: malate dehydrogenase [Spirochaetae bacterium HGW-Spirochaetae-2]
MDVLKEKALNYHSMDGVPGKISVVPTKPCQTADDLSLAYTPGVAKPVLEIENNPEDAYKYTSKGNLVAVISNGTAILGLGDRGALASKPVMEGKGVLFKRFADIDVFDIELNEKDPEKVIQIVKAMEPTFGGVNLEDIKGPECFEIEQRLIEMCNIPIFHDDQHGTAIISTAGLMNAMEIVGKKLSDIKVVVNGAGAAGISCSKMFVAAGVAPENLIMLDSKGVIFKGRQAGMTKEKEEFARETGMRTLAEAMEGADVFMGLSIADCVTPEMLLSMAKDPVVFAMSNPNPEIAYDLAVATRSDLIMATGRSDFPNQINNVLGFPFIFRGALDVRASRISEGMKMAAAKALASLAKEPVPEVVRKAYGGKDFTFGRNYIVPKPFDPRVIEYEAVAVAKAACEEGLALHPITDWEGYRQSLVDRMAHYWN